MKRRMSRPLAEPIPSPTVANPAQSLAFYYIALFCVRKQASARHAVTIMESVLPAEQRHDERPACGDDGPGLRGILLPAVPTDAQDGLSTSDPATGFPGQPCRRGQ